MLGRQEPDPHHRPRNLLGQQLADPPLQASGIGRLLTALFLGSMGLDKNRVIIRAERVKFFFEGRIE
jgi:hypothetical protein